MTRNWPAIPLGELYEFGSGLSKPRSAFGSGYPFLSFKDVFYNSAVPSSLDELVNSTERERSQCSIRRGDVFLTRTSETMDELGMSCVALREVPEATFNGFTKRLRPKHAGTVLPEYARYYFRSPSFRRAVTAMSSLSTRASLNNEMLVRLSIVLPPADVQRAIAHILGTLDDKIELNRRTRETLEAMARTLFTSWFVNFDPVRAKVERGDPGVPGALAAFFPASFVESEMGEIPRGWSLGSLSDIAILNPEAWSKKTRPSSVRYVDLSSTKWGRIEEVAVYNDNSAPSRAQRVLKPMDTIVGTVRPGNGAYALVHAHGLTGSTGFAVLRARRQADFALVYLAATAPENIARLSHLADGGAYPAVRPEVVLASPVVVPPVAVRDAFSAACTDLLRRIAIADEESSSLAAVRHTLLPKLISGEIKVREAERFLADAPI